MTILRNELLTFLCIILGLCLSEPARKRGIPNDFGLPGFPGFASFPSGEILPIPHSRPIFIPKPFLIEEVHRTPSPAEIAAVVAAAKEASADVLAAQHRVNVAKNDVLAQQKIANHKEAQAAIALQQTEAAAAVQRQQASAAANAVVLAQQRLARAKADVAEQQKIAAEKESAAARTIQNSAAAAAAEIRKTEHTAAKVAALQSSEAVAALKHSTAAKDAMLAATAAAIAAGEGHIPLTFRPWQLPANIVYFSPWG